jgi:hypothetical protein
MTAVEFPEPIEAPPFAIDELAVTAWGAGVIDGEGCINCSWSKGRDRTARKVHGAVTVRQAEKGMPLLRTLLLFFGGGIALSKRGIENESSEYVWALYGSNAIPFLRRIGPYLVLKDEQSRLVIELEEYRAREIASGLRRRSPEFMAYAEKVVDRMHELNWRGRTPRSKSPTPTNSNHGGRPPGMKNGTGRTTAIMDSD